MRGSKCCGRFTCWPRLKSTEDLGLEVEEAKTTVMYCTTKLGIGIDFRALGCRRDGGAVRRSASTTQG